MNLFDFKNRSNKQIFFILILAFGAGLLFQPNLKRLYNKGNKQLKVLSQSYTLRKGSCMPEKIVQIPKHSAIVIGHAYGSHKGSEDRGNRGIAPKIKTFYELNKENIDMIIFSGDVLKRPSINRWNNFYSSFPKDLLIYIAPGNHDVSQYSESAQRDIFKLINHRNMKGAKFPLYFSWQNNIFIIDDSNAEEKQLEKVYSLINNFKNHKSLFVIRHHVLPKSLEFAANAKGRQPFLKDLELTKENKRNITFIYGDGGAFKSLPRIACSRINNVNHIVNGIGELPGDTVLVINDHKIYRKEIN